MDDKSYKNKKAYLKPECSKLGNIKEITKYVDIPGEEDDPFGCCS